MQAVLEEYKTLREEILLHIKLEKQVFALSGTLYFLVLSFMTSSKINVNHDYSGVILLLLITPLFVIYRTEHFTIGKIASYIEKCIESKVDGLDWTRLHSQSHLRYPSKFLKWILLSSNTAVSIYFIVLLLLSWLIPAYLKGSFYSRLSLTIMVLLSLVYLWNFIVSLNFRRYRAVWEETWEKALKQS